LRSFSNDSNHHQSLDQLKEENFTLKAKIKSLEQQLEDLR
jgi:hypothetical protein